MSKSAVDELRQQIERVEAGYAEVGRPVIKSTLFCLNYEQTKELLALIDSPLPMVPGRWWRVLEADGSMWCETSDEVEARLELNSSWINEEEDELVYGDPVPGRVLQNLHVRESQNEWVTVK